MRLLYLGPYLTEMLRTMKNDQLIDLPCYHLLIAHLIEIFAAYEPYIHAPEHSCDVWGTNGSATGQFVDAWVCLNDVHGLLHADDDYVDDVGVNDYVNGESLLHDISCQDYSVALFWELTAKAEYLSSGNVVALKPLKFAVDIESRN